ncbi:biotin-protein ligase [Scenedesmus sp. NREL 46B-D3]|nr:biotin-protein ligase [Scenedesmus sp. NREL 46B-D3]
MQVVRASLRQNRQATRPDVESTPAMQISWLWTKPRLHLQRGRGWLEEREEHIRKPATAATRTVPAELLDGSWTSEAALLVMPGGADMPYCNRLNGRGNSLIKSFVHSGGSYLGLCAGAYYACSHVRFEEGSRLQVVGDRELAFFPGIACGAAYPGFDYQTEAGAVAADIQFAVPPLLAQQLQQQGNTPMQQDSSSGSSWCSTQDYCNGGPFFTTHDRQLDVSALPGVQAAGRVALQQRLEHALMAAAHYYSLHWLY